MSGLTGQSRTTSHAEPSSYFCGPVWNYFCLTYSAYLVLPRVSLCSMPLGWQRRFVALMKQAEQMLPDELQGGEYAVQKRVKGRFVKDPLCDYRHPPKVELRPYMRGHMLRQAAKDAGVTP
jgi:hypothetical protein